MNDILTFHIIPKVDSRTLGRLTCTSKDIRHRCRKELRRREILRCARIYRWMPEEFKATLRTSFPGCTQEETYILRQVYIDCWFRRGPREEFKHVDPQAWYYLTDDMKMGAPPDLPCIYNFYMDVIKDMGRI